MLLFDDDNVMPCQMYDRNAMLDVWQALFASMIDVWLWMFDVTLIVRCMLVCVCELDTIIECAFNRVKTEDTMMGSQPQGWTVLGA